MNLDPVPLVNPSVSQGLAGAPTKVSYNLRYAAGVAFVASAGGFLFGYDLVIIAGALPFITREFALSPAWAGWATSSAIMGAIIGPLLGLWFADAIGRRRTMMLSAMLFLASTIGCSVAPSVGEFALWRLVGGMGVGLAMISCPIYIAELSPAPLRGVLVNVNQLVGVIGINLAVLVSYWVAKYDGGWRLMFASQGVPVAFLIIGLLVVPESPRWLAAKGHTRRALEVLKRINGVERAQHELDEIIADVNASPPGPFEVLRPYCRKPLQVSIILMIFSQVNGVNMMLLYGPTILHDAGVSFGSNAVLAAVPNYLMIFVCTIISFPLIHRFSRRGILIASALGMGFSHILMATLLALHAPGLAVLIPMMLGAGTFTLGLAPLSWIIVSEIFPNRVRSQALAIVCVFLFGSSFLTAQLFPMAMDWLRQMTGTPAGMYGVFALVCISCALFVWRMMPETKGVTLEQIGEFWRAREAAGTDRMRAR
jgi:sugar porter (SP) family MFS transporter